MKMENQGINKAAMPLFLEGNNGKAVLLIHGFTGYPGEFYELAGALNREGYTVSLPLLPGHGRNREAFIKTNWSDWLGHVENEYGKLEKSHRSVSVAGLSMGGVLTILLASRFSPERIALLAPAMAVKDPLFNLTPLLKYFIREMPKNWAPQESDSEDVKRLGAEYWTRNYVPQIAGLNRLVRMARKELKNISCPALIMVSEIDGAVPLKAEKIIREGIKKGETKSIILKNSPHVIVGGPEKDYVRDEVIAWIKEGGNK